MADLHFHTTSRTRVNRVESLVRAEFGETPLVPGTLARQDRAQTLLLPQGGRAANQYELPLELKWPAPGKSRVFVKNFTIIEVSSPDDESNGDG